MSDKFIFLVEDNPDDEELTLRAFKKGHVSNPIIVARDGVEALDFMFGNGKFSGRDLSDMPQIVLLDLKLPKINGLEVLQRLRANPSTKFVPVIIFTSSSEEEDIVSSYQFGANSYIRKPVDFQGFADAVHQLGLYWMVLNQTPSPKS